MADHTADTAAAVAEAHNIAGYRDDCIAVGGEGRGVVVADGVLGRREERDSPHRLRLLSLVDICWWCFGGNGSC